MLLGNFTSERPIWTSAKNLPGCATGLLWSIGDRRPALGTLRRTWAVAAVYVALMWSYHFMFERLRRWAKKKLSPDDEAVKFFSRNAKAVLKPGTFVVGALAILDLLGLLSPLLYVVSLPFLTVMNTSISLAVLVEAGITLLNTLSPTAIWCPSRSSTTL